MGSRCLSRQTTGFVTLSFVTFFFLACGEDSGTIAGQRAVGSASVIEPQEALSEVSGCIVKSSQGEVLGWRRFGVGADGVEGRAETRGAAGTDQIAICGQRVSLTDIASIRLVETGLQGGAVGYLEITLRRTK